MENQKLKNETRLLLNIEDAFLAYKKSKKKDLSELSALIKEVYFLQIDKKVRQLYRDQFIKIKELFEEKLNELVSYYYKYEKTMFLVERREIEAENARILHIISMIDELIKQGKKTFAVTGENNGSIVMAKNIEDAKKAFSKKYNNEMILLVREL